MKLRVILVCTLLLLAAVPSFALPLCKECDANNRCQPISGSMETCYSGPGYCYTWPDPCSRPSATTVLTDWTVASIEIVHPAPAPATVEAPARPAETPSPAPAQK